MTQYSADYVGSFLVNIRAELDQRTRTGRREENTKQLVSVIQSGISVRNKRRLGAQAQVQHYITPLIIIY